MPTPSEQKALAFIAIVILLGIFWFGSALEPWFSALARVVTAH